MNSKVSMVAHSRNPRTQDAEAGDNQNKEKKKKKKKRSFNSIVKTDNSCSPVLNSHWKIEAVLTN